MTDLGDEMPADLPKVDFLEAGSGPLVILVHSSVASARQWRKLIELLAGSYHVRAIQLFGYGSSPSWTQERKQTLADQADLIESIIPDATSQVAIVGHSFGGAVAMKAAARLGSRVRSLILLEPNPFDLLRQGGRNDAYREVQGLRDSIKSYGAANDWLPAAERFADYWGGAGTWTAMDDDRRATFANALKPNFHEWDAIMDETTTLRDWVAQLPCATTVIYDPHTVRPIREIVELTEQGTPWTTLAIPRGGHMAPLTHPEVVNPLVREALRNGE
jgi:pimeloyl-ACP methyl ester carboxylesterase